MMLFSPLRSHLIIPYLCHAYVQKDSLLPLALQKVINLNLSMQRLKPMISIT